MGSGFRVREFCWCREDCTKQLRLGQCKASSISILLPLCLIIRDSAEFCGAIRGALLGLVQVN